MKKQRFRVTSRFGQFDLTVPVSDIGPEEGFAIDAAGAGQLILQRGWVRKDSNETSLPQVGPGLSFVHNAGKA